MDHIPIPVDPVCPPVLIPCLSDLQYDGLDFNTYPARRGWDLGRLLAGDCTQHHGTQETAAFLQDWLYFGTLATILGDAAAIKTAYVVLDDKGSGQYGRVNTARLPQHLQERLVFVKAMAYEQPDYASSLVRSMEKCLQTLSHLCWLFDCQVEEDQQKPKGDAAVWPLPPEVDLSLRVLGQLLASSVYGALMTDIITGRLPHSNLPQFRFAPGRLLAVQMRRLGWCPSDVSMVSQEFSPSTVYHVSMMKRGATTRQHSTCTSHKCLAFQIDDSVYRTRHCEDSCEGDCGFIGPAVSEIVKIISDGGTPLVSIVVAEDSGTVQIKAEPYKSGQEYVCFSHVWSDGLGNSHENKLPRCQILRLKGLLDELGGMKTNRELLNKGRFGALVRRHRGGGGVSTRFWIDTLCVPVQEEHKDARKLAIRRMNDVYRGAFQLLVLDAELQSVTVASDLQETLLRISVCGWMRRLWTLLEGVVGSRAHVKFRDCIVDVEGTYHAFGEHDKKHDVGRSIRHVQGSLAADASKFYWKMALFRRTIRSSDIVQRNILGYQVTVDFKFVHGKTETIKYSPERELAGECHAVMEAFVASRWRTTSRKEDVYLCLGALLNCDTRELSSLPVDRRMRHLREQRSHLPQGLIFVSGHRMRDVGWRWAVTDFDFQGTSHLHASIPINDYTPARRDATGLTVKYPGLILPAAMTSVGGMELLVSSAVDDAGTGWWRIRTSGEEASTSLDSHARRLAVLFYDGRGNVNFPFPPGVTMAAALVSVDLDLTHQDATICTYLSLATVETVGSVEELTALRQRNGSNFEVGEVEEAKLVRRTWTVQ